MYFGPEGSGAYRVAALAVTAFTMFYAWRGGLRRSLLTDAGQMLLAAVLLVVVPVAVFPPLPERGIPEVPDTVHWAGVTFIALAAVQVLSYIPS